MYLKIESGPFEVNCDHLLEARINGHCRVCNDTGTRTVRLEGDVKVQITDGCLHTVPIFLPTTVSLNAVQGDPADVLRRLILACHQHNDLPDLPKEIQDQLKECRYDKYSLTY